jgi:hypothetical protein
MCYIECTAGKHNALQLTSASMWTTAALSGIWTIHEAASIDSWNANTTLQQLEHAAPSLLFLGIVATAITNWLQVMHIIHLLFCTYKSVITTCRREQ